MTTIPVRSVLPNPEQPRREFDQAGLNELAASLRVNGLIQPIVVEEAGEAWILIDGERRLRAARIAGWTEIEAVVRPAMNGRGAAERAVLALVANLQRADLNAVEEALAYQALIKTGMSRAAIAHRVGVSIARVTSRLQILELEGEIQDLMAANLLPIDPRVTAALLSVPETHRCDLARKLARPGLRIATVVSSAEKLNAALTAERIHDEPAITLAHRAVGAPVMPKWDALAQIGQLPAWDQVAAAARRTCGACELRREACKAVCGRCPAVTMLIELIGATRRQA